MRKKLDQKFRSNTNSKLLSEVQAKTLEDQLICCLIILFQDSIKDSFRDLHETLDRLAFI